jgi:oxalate decarboxylase
MSNPQRRDFLAGAAGLAAAAATLGGTGPAPAGKPELGDKPPEPVRGNQGAPILGPRNPAREAQSPDRLRPPPTDSGTLPTLRWSFADSHVKMREGGWSRQTTAREIPASTDLALVNMRLKAGGVRELHWHKAAEWAFMLKGRARITAIDPDGHAFQDDTIPEYLFTRPPRMVQRLLFGLLAPLARLLGYRGSYPECLARAPSGFVAVEPLDVAAALADFGKAHPAEPVKDVNGLP